MSATFVLTLSGFTHLGCERCHVQRVEVPSLAGLLSIPTHPPLTRWANDLRRLWRLLLSAMFAVRTIDAGFHYQVLYALPSLDVWADELFTSVIPVSCWSIDCV